MTRQTVIAMKTSNLASRKYKEFCDTFNPFNLKEQIEGLNEKPNRTEIMKYLEDDTNEIRSVICYKYGVPTQMEIRFYTQRLAAKENV